MLCASVVSLYSRTCYALLFLFIHGNFAMLTGEQGAYMLGAEEGRHKCSLHPKYLDPLKNGTLAVQTIRNNLMATTQLATIAITLSSVITALVSNLSSSSSSELQSSGLTIIYTSTHIKFFSVLLCFLLAFFGHLQSIRYYAHVSFLVSTATSQGNPQEINYVVRNLNRGSLFWSFGMRAFYFSFPFLLWNFGCVEMFICSCVITIMLYFLDTTSHFEEYGGQEEEEEEIDPRDRDGHSGVVDSSAIGSAPSGNSNSTLRLPLLRHTSEERIPNKIRGQVKLGGGDHEIQLSPRASRGV